MVKRCSFILIFVYCLSILAIEAAPYCPLVKPQNPSFYEENCTPVLPKQHNQHTQQTPSNTIQTQMLNPLRPVAPALTTKQSTTQAQPPTRSTTPPTTSSSKPKHTPYRYVPPPPFNPWAKPSNTHSNTQKSQSQKAQSQSPWHYLE